MSQTDTKQRKAPEVVFGKGVEVVVGNPNAKKRKIIVELDCEHPRFEFQGNWRGKDVMNLHNTLRRAYMVRNLHIRRASSTSEKKQEQSPEPQTAGSPQQER
jgi:hypothetical protein